MYEDQVQHIVQHGPCSCTWPACQWPACPGLGSGSGPNFHTSDRLVLKWSTDNCCKSTLFSHCIAVFFFWSNLCQYLLTPFCIWASFQCFEHLSPAPLLQTWSSCSQKCNSSVCEMMRKWIGIDCRKPTKSTTRKYPADQPKAPNVSPAEKGNPKHSNAQM